MSENPISPLRRRMIEDMTVRNFVEKTRNDYIRHVRTFAAFLGRSPDKAVPEDLRRFQLHQTQTGVRPPSINGAVAALRFFFTVTLDRPEMARHLTFVREPRKMPAVLSPEEVARLLEAAPGPKYKAALSAGSWPDFAKHRPPTSRGGCSVCMAAAANSGAWACSREVERLLKMHGIDFRLSAGNKRLALDLVQPIVMMKHRD